jgi:hypothetical protein
MMKSDRRGPSPIFVAGQIPISRLAGSHLGNFNFHFFFDPLARLYDSGTPLFQVTSLLVPSSRTESKRARLLPFIEMVQYMTFAR